MDPEYYLSVHSISDLPYDFYRVEKESNRIPIILLMENGETKELSKASFVVESLTGRIQTDRKLFYPIDKLLDKNTYKEEKERILKILAID